ncbi:MAG TPA: class I SAM-dependent methyltransferase [Bryobacteraceae bacterium]
MNVQEKVRELRRRVEREVSQESACRSVSAERALEELEVFRSSCSRLSSIGDSVGRMPPSPNTRRARLGSFLIRIIQRALFWYTPQIVRFQNEVAHALSTGCSLFETQRQQIDAQRHEIRILKGELPRIRSQASRPVQSTVAGNAASGAAIAPVCAGCADQRLLDSFLFANYGRLRGSDGETAKKLEPYLHVTRSLSIPDGPWLDLGCGRGEWLTMAGASGHTVVGVDSNPSAVSYCQEIGLDAAEEDALQHLRTAHSQSVAVISAFHLIEHCRTVDLLALVRESVRVLKPGGMLIFETPDPANLVMASHLFWRDPSHRQPVPMLLLELIFEYFGLMVIERLRLNPPPAAERLPFGELEFVRRLNQHLYGPQDYGLIGRR